MTSFPTEADVFRLLYSITRFEASDRPSEAGRLVLEAATAVCWSGDLAAAGRKVTVPSGPAVVAESESKEYGTSYKECRLLLSWI